MHSKTTWAEIKIGGVMLGELDMHSEMILCLIDNCTVLKVYCQYSNQFVKVNEASKMPSARTEHKNLQI